MSNHKRRYGQLDGTEYVCTLYTPCQADSGVGWMTCPLFLWAIIICGIIPLMAMIPIQMISLLDLKPGTGVAKLPKERGG